MRWPCMPAVGLAVGAFDFVRCFPLRYGDSIARGEFMLALVQRAPDDKRGQARQLMTALEPRTLVQSTSRPEGLFGIE
jgi:hypothetical protein